MLTSYNQEINNIFEDMINNPPKKIKVIFNHAELLFDMIVDKNFFTTNTLLELFITISDVSEAIEKNFSKIETKKYLINYLAVEYLYDLKNTHWSFYADIDDYIFYRTDIVECVTDIQDFLKIINNENESKKNTLFFRGQKNVEWELIPAIFRDEHVYSEEKFYTQLKRREPDEFENLSIIDQMVKMQHYGLPTRLLDLTYNPLIALYFATDNNINTYGGVYIFDEELKNDEINDHNIEIVANCIKIREQWKDVPEFLLASKKYNPEIENYSDLEIINILSNNYFIEVSNTNERIKRQQGAFILFGMDFQSFNFCKSIDKELDSKIIIIPNDMKDKLRDQLELLGIHTAFLFPELEFQAQYIKKKYKQPFRTTTRLIRKGEIIEKRSIINSPLKNEEINLDEKQKNANQKLDEIVNNICFEYKISDTKLKCEKDYQEAINAQDWYFSERKKTALMMIIIDLIDSYIGITNQQRESLKIQIRSELEDF